MASTILHELLHIPGYDHENAIDYACEYFCFPPKKVEMEKYRTQAAVYARDICNGKYSYPDGIEYLRSIGNLQLVDEAFMKVILKRIYASLLRHPGNDRLKLMFAAYAQDSWAWPFAFDLSGELKTRYAGRTLTPKESEWFNMLSPAEEKKLKPPAEFQQSASLLAKSFISFFDGHSEKTAELLKGATLPASRKSKTLTDWGFESMKLHFIFLVDLLKTSLEDDAEGVKKRLGS